MFHRHEKHSILTRSHSYSNLKSTTFKLHTILAGFWDKNTLKKYFLQYNGYVIDVRIKVKFMMQ